MAEIVAIAGVPHNPFLPKLLNQAEIPRAAQATAQRFHEFRERLEAAAPDRVVIVGSDHLRQWFMDNMPAFLVGKAQAIPGVFPDETVGYGLEPCQYQGDTDLAASILGHGQLAPEGIDFSFSNEFGLDHAFVVPLSFLDPDHRLPIVPIFTNGVAPPLPAAERFIALGQHLETVLTSDSVQGRVAVIVSGHLSIEVGGPKMFRGQPYDREFDERAAHWVATGDIDGLVAECTLDRLLSAGNVTYQFLNFVSAMTLAGGRPAVVADWVQTAGESLPFFWWDYPKTQSEGGRT